MTLCVPRQNQAEQLMDHFVSDASPERSAGLSVCLYCCDWHSVVMSNYSEYIGRHLESYCISLTHEKELSYCCYAGQREQQTESQR